MSRKVKLNKKELSSKIAILVVVAIVLVISCLFFSAPIEKALGIGITEKSGKYVDADVVMQNQMVVHYLDVGQADCTLIELPDGKTMLIDAGDIETKQEVVEYIKAVLGQSTIIDYFVLTHSDSDHVGGAVNVLTNFDVLNIYRPLAFAGYSKVGDSTSFDNFDCSSAENLSFVYNYLKSKNQDSEEYKLVKNLPRIYTTVYNQTIQAIYNEHAEGANVCVSYDGLVLDTTGYEIEFYAPLVADCSVAIETLSNKTTGKITKGYGTGAEGKNAISPVIRVEYQDAKFVFTGDITDNAEEDVLDSLQSQDIEELKDADVYQAGHHGASNSNTQEFLNLLSPTYTVVSSNNEGNEYGHPTPEFLERLEKVGHDITDYLLRTDMQGNIIFGVSDSGVITYAANIELENTVFEVAWWQVAVGIFIVTAVVLFNIKVPKQAKRKYSK